MISKITKICLTIHKKDKEAVLNLLQEAGVAEIEDWQVKETQQSETMDKESEYGLAQVKFALDFLSQYISIISGTLFWPICMSSRAIPSSG